MQRRALGVLFCVIATMLVGVAIAALVGAGGQAKGWIVAVAAVAIAGWLGSVGVSALRR